MWGYLAGTEHETKRLTDLLPLIQFRTKSTSKKKKIEVHLERISIAHSK